MNNLTLENWNEQYRRKYEGANAWSSKAIDSQLADIQTLLDLKESEMKKESNKDTRLYETLYVLRREVKNSDEYYSVVVECTNCNYFSMESNYIHKGVPVSSATCPTCELKTLTRKR